MRASFASKRRRTKRTVRQRRIFQTRFVDDRHYFNAGSQSYRFRLGLVWRRLVQRYLLLESYSMRPALFVWRPVSEKLSPALRIMGLVLKKYRRVAIVKESRARAREWREFVIHEHVHSESRKVVETRFRRLCVRSAALHMRTHVFEGAAVLIALCVLLLLLVQASFIEPKSPFVKAAFFATFIGGYMMQGLIIVRLGRRLPNLPALFLAFAVPVGILAAIWQIAGRFQRPPLPDLLLIRSDELGQAALAGAALSSIVGFLYSGIVVSGILFQAVDRRSILRRDPDAVIFESLMLLAKELALPPRLLAATEKRKEIIGKLDSAAADIEFGLKKGIRLPSFASDEIAKRRVDLIAKSMRSYQVDVALPSLETWAEVRRMVSAVAVAICTGRVGSLQVRQVAEMGNKRGWVKASLAVLRSISVALMPLVVVVALNSAGLLGKDAISRAIITAAIVWATVGLLSTADPLLNSRIQATKDIVSLFKVDSKK